MPPENEGKMEERNMVQDHDKENKLNEEQKEEQETAAENAAKNETVDQDETKNEVHKEDIENGEIAALKEKIDELEKKLEEKENRILRLQADFDNYRKRVRNEIDSIKKYRSEALATELLGVIDNFERALEVEVKSEDGKALLQGVEMVYKSMLEAFKKEGIEAIEAVGKEFNPHEHHAVAQGSDDSKESNIVLEEFQKGYKLKDRVIRPSMVKVNQ